MSYRTESKKKNRYAFGITKQGESSEYIYISLAYEETQSTTEPGGYYTFSADEDLSYELITETTGEVDPLDKYGTEKVEIISTAAQLQGIISTWYFILRNIALLVLMLLLIYTGIRIVIGSTAGEKAKYKERLTDWLVAICLIFIMHYIMVFAVELVEKLVDLVSSTTSNGNMGYIELTADQEANAKEILKGYNTIGYAKNKEGVTGKDGGGAIAYYDENGNPIGKDEHGVLIWPTDLAGLFRIESQITETGTIQWVGYALCYVVLVLFTLFFAFTYAKRVLYMAFLTMIAPLVAMTYPIDKLTDGKAQAFDSWLKEYIFNLMIQPLHILLYTVLVSSAYSLASNSPIYALVAMGFMMPAEKLMRRFFGFEKAKTPGLLGGAAGAALAMTGLQSIMRHNSKGKHGSSGHSDDAKADNSKTRYSNPNNTSAKTQALGDGDISQYSDEKREDKEDDNIDLKDTSHETEDEHEEVAGGRRIDSQLPNSSDGANPEGGAKKLYKFTSKNVTPQEKARIQGQQVGAQIRGERKAAERAQAAEKKAVEEAQKKAAEEAQKKAAQEAQKKAAEEAQKKAAQEAQKKAAQEAQKKAAEEARKKKAQTTKLKRFGRAIGGVSSAYAKNLGGRALKRVQNANPVKSMLRGATGLAGAAAFGLAGTALGVASGDPSKAFQYASAGALGGYKLGSGTADSVVDAISPTNTNEIVDEYERGWYGDEYIQKKYEEDRDKKLDSDQHNRLLRDNGYATKEEREEFNETLGKFYHDQGLGETEDMLAIENYIKEIEKERADKGETMKEEEKQALRVKAIGITRLKNKLPQKISSMTDEKKEKYRVTYENNIRKQLQDQYSDWKTNEKTRNQIENAAYENSVQYIKMMEKLEGQKSDLKMT